MTTSRFELTPQRQKVSRLPTEPPGRPAVMLFFIRVWRSVFIFEVATRPNKNEPLQFEDYGDAQNTVKFK